MGVPTTGPCVPLLTFLLRDLCPSLQMLDSAPLLGISNLAHPGGGVVPAAGKNRANPSSRVLAVAQSPDPGPFRSLSPLPGSDASRVFKTSLPETHSQKCCAFYTAPHACPVYWPLPHVDRACGCRPLGFPGPSWWASRRDLGRRQGSEAKYSFPIDCHRLAGLLPGPVTTAPV